MNLALSSAQWADLLQKMGIAVLCGAAIGMEREWARKQAGFRTMILICLGSTLYITVSKLASTSAGQMFDVTRIASQVVTGVGFIGAGAIIQARGHVAGLTTAATIWVTAAIGLLVGAGYLLLAMAATAIVILVLTVVFRIERIFVKNVVEQDYDSDNDLIVEDKKNE